MSKRKESCVMTGHRFLPPEIIPTLTQHIEAAISDLYMRGIYHYYVGASIGFDMLAAESVLKMQETFPAIRLHEVVPFHGFEEYWSLDNQTRYHKIMQKASSITYLSRYYSKESYSLRNSFMVDHASVCLCFLKKKEGGTFQTVEMARERGLDILPIQLDIQFSLF